jgi:hypothetical protein
MSLGHQLKFIVISKFLVTRQQAERQKFFVACFCPRDSIATYVAAENSILLPYLEECCLKGAQFAEGVYLAAQKRKKDLGHYLLNMTVRWITQGRQQDRKPTLAYASVARKFKRGRFSPAGPRTHRACNPAGRTRYRRSGFPALITADQVGHGRSAALTQSTGIQRCRRVEARRSDPASPIKLLSVAIRRPALVDAGGPVPAELRGN